MYNNEILNLFFFSSQYALYPGVKILYMFQNNIIKHMLHKNRFLPTYSFEACA